MSHTYNHALFISIMSDYSVFKRNRRAISNPGKSVSLYPAVVFGLFELLDIGLLKYGTLKTSELPPRTCKHTYCHGE